MFDRLVGPEVVEERVDLDEFAKLRALRPLMRRAYPGAGHAQTPLFGRFCRVGTATTRPRSISRFRMRPTVETEAARP